MMGIAFAELLMGGQFANQTPHRSGHARCLRTPDMEKVVLVGEIYRGQKWENLYRLHEKVTPQELPRGYDVWIRDIKPKSTVQPSASEPMSYILDTEESTVCDVLSKQ